MLEGLACAGAFDSLKEEAEATDSWRARLYGAIDTALARSARTRRAKLLGQNELFGGTAEVEEGGCELPRAKPWSHAEMLAAEKKALGFYITGHPLDSYADIILGLATSSTTETNSLDSGSPARVAGLITDLQSRTTKKGSRFAILRLEDQGGAIKCVLWPESFNRSGSVLKDNAAVLITGRAEISEDGLATVIVEDVLALDEAVQRKANELVITLPVSSDVAALCAEVTTTLNQSTGDCEVFVEVAVSGGLVRIHAHPSLKVQGSIELEQALRNLGCDIRWQGHARARAASG